MNKKEIRKSIINKRKSLSKNEVENMSSIIIKKIIQEEFFKNSKNIAMYYPYKNEVDLLDIFKENKDFKNFLFPKVHGKEMIFHLVKDLDDFSKGNFNIMEPKTKVFQGHIDLFLIPGVAFSPHQYRIGYGGGFYDKYISKNVNKSKLIGIAFDLQIIENLPVEKHDQKLDMIITNKGVYKK
ncbi:MAG: 5-formyltetrahydrofolate cyclo-ligase [Thermotogota bacterium]